MRNRKMSQVPDSFRPLKLAEMWRFQIVSARRIYLETWRMYSFRNRNLLKSHFYIAKTLQIILVVCKVFETET